MRFPKSIFSGWLKKPYLLIIAILVCIVIHSPLEDALNSLLVAPLFSKVDSNSLNDIIFTALGFVVAFAWVKPKQYVATASTIVLFSLMILLYLYYRIFSHEWVFVSFYNIKRLAYADVFGGLFVVELFVFIRTCYNIFAKDGGKEPKPQVTLVNDEPITKEEDDSLGYKSYARTIALDIDNNKFEKSFAIGVNGKWGSGKTSFVNLIKEDIDKDLCIIIDFSPWNSNTANGIIQDFFETVQEKVSPLYSSLSQLLRDYSDKIVKLNDNTVTSSIKSAVNMVSGGDSLKTMYNDINIALRKIDKRLVVFIDDLDRADKDEITEVLRLIRNNANFYNTFFIVAYDRDYVVDALLNRGVFNHSKFLEKIFQLEVSLPYFNPDKIKGDLFIKLNKLFPDHFDIIKEAVQVPGFARRGVMFEYLENIRDVTRFCNSLSLNSRSLLGEVDLVDFFNVELLRMKYPAVYSLLFKKTDDYLTTTNANNYMQDNRSKYRLDTTHGKNNSNTSFEIEIFLDNNYADLSLTKGDVQRAMGLLKVLFEDERFGGNERAYLSIAYPSNFGLG